jgi:hypothetical protein
VEVKGEAPAVETASSALGAVNNGETVRELPLNGRDWTSLADLQPGVTVIRTEAAVGAGLANTRGNRGLGQMMSISGNRPEQNNYRLDGVSLNDYAGSGPASVLGVALGVDAIEEFSVVTNNAPADYGKTSGGVINAVTRAGTDHMSRYLVRSRGQVRRAVEPGGTGDNAPNLVRIELLDSDIRAGYHGARRVGNRPANRAARQLRAGRHGGQKKHNER